MKKTHWKIALEQIKNGKQIKKNEINFNQELLHWTVVQEFNDLDFQVPEELVDYDDDNIDFSDIPEMTEEELHSEDIRFLINTELSLKYEIKQCLQKENINLNELASKLVSVFFETHKNLPKKES